MFFDLRFSTFQFEIPFSVFRFPFSVFRFPFSVFRKIKNKQTKMATTTSSSGPKSLKVWIGIFLLGTLIGLANFNRFTTEELAQNNKPPIAKIFINEMTGAYTILLLLPPLFAFFRKFSLRRGQLVKLIPLHLLASVAFGASHTLLMFLSRKLIYWLAFGINYNYGRLDIRFLMEYNHQIITYWVMYGIFFAVNAFRDIQRQKLQASQLQEQLTAARLQALQMQLNPHFLFNTLNMISSTMYDSIEKADAMLTRLSDLLRATLGSAQTVQHTVARELELIDLYIEIMKARFDDKLQFSLDIDAQTQSALVPSFILQPLVENAILHTMQAVQKAEIGIVSQRDGERLVLIVTDNGPGIDAGQQANNDKGIVAFSIEPCRAGAKSIESGRDGRAANNGRCRATAEKVLEELDQSLEQIPTGNRRRCGLQVGVVRLGRVLRFIAFLILVGLATRVVHRATGRHALLIPPEQVQLLQPNHGDSTRNLARVPVSTDNVGDLHSALECPTHVGKLYVDEVGEDLAQHFSGELQCFDDSLRKRQVPGECLDDSDQQVAIGLPVEGPRVATKSIDLPG